MIFVYPKKVILLSLACIISQSMLICECFKLTYNFENYNTVFFRPKNTGLKFRRFETEHFGPNRFTHFHIDHQYVIACILEKLEKTQQSLNVVQVKCNGQTHNFFRLHLLFIQHLHEYPLQMNCRPIGLNVKGLKRQKSSQVKSEHIILIFPNS